MPKFSPIRLLEKLILPFVLIITAKVGTIFLASLFLGVPWSFGGNSFGLLFFSFANSQQAALISTLSDWVASVVCGLGFCWVVFRSQHLNMEKLHPRQAVHALRKSKHLLTSTREIIHEGISWLLLAFAVTAVTWVNIISGFSSPVVGSFALIVCSILGYAFLLEILEVKSLSVKHVDN